MGRSSGLALVSIVLLLLAAMFVTSSEGRKFMVLKEHNNDNNNNNKKPDGAASLADPSSESSWRSLFLSALPKGRVPSSAPSKKGHAEVVNEKLVARHLITINDRSLRSVPSPGVGH